MSSGAELQILAAPVALGVIAPLVLAAGVAVVGGIVVVGTTRLALAGGAYARERVRQRADMCAGEYGHFQQLKKLAQAQAAAARQPAPTTRPILTPQPTRQATNQPKFHQDPAIDAEVAARMAAELQAEHARYQARLERIQQQARLDALVQTNREQLRPEIVDAANAALAAGDMATMRQAMASVRAELARRGTALLRQAQAELDEHHADVSALLAVVYDPAIRQQLVDWQYRLHPLLRSTDLAGIRNYLREGQALLERLRAAHEQALESLRDAELAPLWGKLQAVGGLFSDVQALQTAYALPVGGELLTQLQAVATRYEALATDPEIEPSKLQSEAADLRRTLQKLEAAALTVLNSAYSERLSSEIEQGLRQMATDGFSFDQIRRTVATDGSVKIKASQGRRRFNVTIRDGQVVYDTHGFGDEQCLAAVYSFLDRLIDRGVQLQADEPQLTPQMNMVLQVKEALKQLHHYSDDDITVREDADVVTIEASKGPLGFQRVKVDEDGRVEIKDQATGAIPAVQPEIGAAAVEQRISQVRQKAQQNAQQNAQQKQQLR